MGYFGVKSAKVCRLGPRCAKVRRGPHPAPTGASAKRSSIHAASKVAKVGAAGGPKLLNCGAVSGPGRGRVKSAKVRPQAASHKKVSAPQKKVFALRRRTKVAKVGPLRASNLLKSDRPLTSRTPGWTNHQKECALDPLLVPALLALAGDSTSCCFVGRRGEKTRHNVNDNGRINEVVRPLSLCLVFISPRRPSNTT